MSIRIFLYCVNLANISSKLLSIAILAFGLTSPKTLSIATGVVVGFVGLVQMGFYLKVSFQLNLSPSYLFVVQQFPNYYDAKEKYQP